MTRIRFALGSLLFLAFLVSAAQAQNQRTFVSGAAGASDGNPCSRLSPCRTFGVAIGVTNSGGEVIALDSAGYAAFAVNKAVSVIAPPGVYAGITVFGGDGIDINAGVSDTVILRGLTVNSQGGTNGIVFNTGKTLQIEGCAVNGFSSDGIKNAGSGSLFVKNTIARNNTGTGIDLAPASGSSLAALDNLTLEENGIGLFLAGGATATVRNTNASGNTNTGMEAAATSGFAELNIENCLIANNVTAGVLSGGNSTVRVAGSTVTDNGTGFFQFNTGVLQTRGNNTLQGNGIATQGTIGTFPSS